MAVILKTMQTAAMFGLFLALFSISTSDTTFLRGGPTQLPAGFQFPEQLHEIGLFCPGQTICGRGNVTAAHVGDTGSGSAASGDRSSCCIDCSCDADCGLSGNCCFDELDTYKLEDSIPCVYATTAFDPSPEFFESFRMIDSCPETSGDDLLEYSTNKTSCGDQKLYVWGSLLPIYSPGTGEIYKNKACADCHDVTDGVEWTQELECQQKIVETILDNILNDFENSFCDIHFIYKGNTDDIKRHRCYSNFRDKKVGGCRMPAHALVLPTGSNMTSEQLTYACEESGLKSPVMSIKGNLYTNIFCAACNTNMQPTYDSDCTVLDPSQRTATTSFVCLLDVEAMASKFRLDATQETTPVVCPSHAPYRSYNKCYRTLCPSATLRDTTGRCQYISDQWSVSEFEICLKLNPSDQIPIDELTPIIEYIEANRDLPDNLQSPWEQKWKLHNFMYAEGNASESGTKTLDEIVLILRFKARSINANAFFKKIKKSLSDAWRLKSNGKTLALFQEHMSFCLFRPSPDASEFGSGTQFGQPIGGFGSRLRRFSIDLRGGPGSSAGPDTVVPVWSMSQPEHGDPKMVLQSSNKTYRTLAAFSDAFSGVRFSGSPLKITKLYFCEQIELSGEDLVQVRYAFDQLVQDRIWYYEAEDKYLFGDDFVELKYSNVDVRRYRVCAAIATNQATSGLQQTGTWRTVLGVVCLQMLFLVQSNMRMR